MSVTLSFLLFIMVVSICTINVNAIAKLPKREQIFKYLLDKHFDIYLLQEKIYQMSRKVSCGRLNGAVMQYTNCVWIPTLQLNPPRAFWKNAMPLKNPLH